MSQALTVLALNAGSSSIKYALITMPREQTLLLGELDRIGDGDAKRRYRLGTGSWQSGPGVADHAQGFASIVAQIRELAEADAGCRPQLVGHRIVHGGPDLADAAVIDAGVQARIEAASTLAPLHGRAGLEGLGAMRRGLSGIPQVAVFDTGFHRGLPDHASHYALPVALQRELQIRRYGFHGLSHRHAAGVAAQWLGRPLTGLKLICLHLGSGASACAIRNGRSQDTSMGTTPLEGLVMGSRCGDLDPALVSLIAERRGWSPQRVERLLNRESGLQGLCGDSDMRRIEARRAQGDAAARLAFDLFCYRVRKYVGAYFAALNGIDALIFTGGIGEHSAAVRAAVCAELDALGIRIDQARNADDGRALRAVSPEVCQVPVLVVPGNEVLEIARQAYAQVRAD